ncbi:MAG: D-alanyl-D-alanine carboxypeptidase family protein [Thermodesulfobacteriota bacterium]
MENLPVWKREAWPNRASRELSLRARKATFKAFPALLSQNWKIWLRSLFFGLLFLFGPTLGSSSCFAYLHFRAALVMDDNTGKIIYCKNSNLRLPPASTTKLMTAILVLEKAELSKVVTISKRAVQVEPVKIGFKEGDKLRVEDLLYAVLLKSANDAAVALAETVAGTEKNFVELMNKKAYFLDLKNTKFINATGLPGPGQYTTAADLSKLMSYALEFPKIREIMETPEAKISTAEGKVFFLRTTNRLLESPEKVIGKTGFTQRAKHCFVGALKKGTKNIVFAILGSENRKNLWLEAKRLTISGYGKQGRRAKDYLGRQKYSLSLKS